MTLREGAVVSDMQTLQAKLSDTRASIESMRKFLSGKTKLEALFTIDCLRWREQDLIWKINRCMVIKVGESERE